MLSLKAFYQKRLLFDAQRSFSSLSGSIQSALIKAKDSAEDSSFFESFYNSLSSVHARDLQTDDVLRLCQVLSHHTAAPESPIYSTLNEYFRVHFRKISLAEALQLTEAISPIGGYMDAQFWVWEALEEAIKPHIYEISKKDFVTVRETFLGTQNASDDLMSYIRYRNVLDLKVW